MNNLYIDYENGKALGNKIKDESQELKKLLSELNDVQDKLKKYIDLVALETYAKPLTTKTKIMNKLVDLTSETSNLLINISDAYLKVENSSKMEE